MTCRIIFRLDQGLLIINKLNRRKFGTLVNNICHRQQRKSSDQLFSKDEKEQLQTSLELNQNEVEDLVHAIGMIISKASFSNVDTDAMEKTLTTLFSIDKEKVDVLCEIWSMEGQNLIHALEERSIFPKVTSIDWSMDVGTCSTIRAKEAQCNVKLQLGLEEDDKEKKLTVQMDRTSLTNLYETLEKIQSKLDQLKK